MAAVGGLHVCAKIVPTSAPQPGRRGRPHISVGCIVLVVERQVATTKGSTEGINRKL